MTSVPDFKTALVYLTAGIEFVVAFGLCAAAGVYLDGWRGGGTLWPVVGGALGFAIGLWNLIRTAKSDRNREDQENKKQ